MMAGRTAVGDRFGGEGAAWMEAAVAWYEQVETVFLRNSRRPRRTADESGRNAGAANDRTAMATDPTTTP